MANSPNGIKLFGATITLQDRKATDSPDNNDPTQMGEMKRPDKIIPCPRCKSMETKFCYFNNYNVNQPRHFCKGCQRYWTAGGALRNVPVGAGRRKNKPVPCGRGFSEMGCGLYDANSDVQQYLDLDDGHPVMVENSWHLMAAAQGGFRQVFPAVKRRRNGEDIGDRARAV